LSLSSFSSSLNGAVVWLPCTCLLSLLLAPCDSLELLPALAGELATAGLHDDISPLSSWWISAKALSSIAGDPGSPDFLESALSSLSSPD